MNYNIQVKRDEDPISPRDWDNLGVMVFLHSRYSLGDKHDYNANSFSGWDELEKELVKEEDVVVILPVYMFDHSGITISCSRERFRVCDPQGWDHGQIGFIFARRTDVRNEYSKKRISKQILKKVEDVLVSEVNTYDQYLTGDVWGYVIEDDDGNHIDSCWGFFGYDYCKQEAASVVEYMEKRDKENAAELKRIQAAMPCCLP